MDDVIAGPDSKIAEQNPVWVGEDGNVTKRSILNYVSSGKDVLGDESKGATYQKKEYPVNSKVKVSNVSGAGDTFVAGLVYSYIRHGLIDNAINFANDCSSKVVQERGVTIIT